MTFDNITDFEAVAEAAREVARVHFNTGKFPSKELERLQPYYASSDTRRELLEAMNEHVSLSENPFDGSYDMIDPYNLRNPYACIELSDVIANQVPPPAEECYVENKESKAILNARIQAIHDESRPITVYRIMPTRIPAREAFQAPTQIMFSLQMAEQEFEFCQYEGYEAKISAAKLPSRRIYFDTTSDVLGRCFYYDPSR